MEESRHRPEGRKNPWTMFPTFFPTWFRNRGVFFLFSLKPKTREYVLAFICMVGHEMHRFYYSGFSAGSLEPAIPSCFPNIDSGV
jgi:hypothetical protein